MKIKSLLLGSVAVLGLSSGAYAADLTVLSLGLCDGFGIWSPENPNYEGDTHCVRVTGGVDYELVWGDGVDGYAVDGNADWTSTVEAWMQWVGIANGTTGPVAAVIKFKDVYQVSADGAAGTVVAGGDDTGGVVMDQAYAQAMIGDNVYIAGGLKDSIANTDTDNAFDDFDSVDGIVYDVEWGTGSFLDGGGHSLQGSVDLGNGLMLLVGLEDFNNTTYASAGDFFGTLEYSGSNFAAHATVGVGGFADTVFDSFGGQVGAVATLDWVELSLAASVDSQAGVLSYSALGTAAFMFDTVTFVLNGGVDSDAGAPLAYYAGAAVHWAISDDVTFEVAAAYVDPDSTVANDELVSGAGAIIWTPTDIWTVTGTAEVAYTFAGVFSYEVGAEVAADLGGGFNASLAGSYASTGAYSATIGVSDDIE